MTQNLFAHILKAFNNNLQRSYYMSGTDLAHDSKVVRQKVTEVDGKTVL